MGSLNSSLEKQSFGRLLLQFPKIKKKAIFRASIPFSKKGICETNNTNKIHCRRFWESVIKPVIILSNTTAILFYSPFVGSDMVWHNSGLKRQELEMNEWMETISVLMIFAVMLCHLSSAVKAWKFQAFFSLLLKEHNITAKIIINIEKISRCRQTDYVNRTECVTLPHDYISTFNQSDHCFLESWLLKLPNFGITPNKP